jgi:starvation-inducible DNA-binding protein
MNDELNEQLKSVLADSFMLYLKAQGYHWNVEGILFPMLHEFFQKIYEEVYSSIDQTAEEIRARDGQAPHTLIELDKYRTIMDSSAVGAQSMIADLKVANQAVIESLFKAIAMAEQKNEQGLMDYLAGRIDAHKKHNWMLTATLKSSGEQ